MVQVEICVEIKVLASFFPCGTFQMSDLFRGVDRPANPTGGDYLDINCAIPEKLF
jgi:hypothetical protein